MWLKSMVHLLENLLINSMNKKIAELKEEMRLVSMKQISDEIEMKKPL